MRSQWDDWLREMKRAQLGGDELGMPPIIRGLPYTNVFAFPVDVSAETFTATLVDGPSVDAALLATFTMTVGAYSGGATNVTVSLSAATVNGIVAEDDDLDGVTEAVFLMDQGVGAGLFRVMAGNIVISG